VQQCRDQQAKTTTAGKPGAIRCQRVVTATQPKNQMPPTYADASMYADRGGAIAQANKSPV
jgi:hypothetical protein